MAKRKKQKIQKKKAPKNKNQSAEEQENKISRKTEWENKIVKNYRRQNDEIFGISCGEIMSISIQPERNESRERNKNKWQKNDN